MRWIGTELQDPPVYDGTGTVSNLIEGMEFRVAEEKRIPALDAVLRGTPARWWATQKGDLLPTWDDVQPVMMHRFVAPPEFEAQDIAEGRG